MHSALQTNLSDGSKLVLKWVTLMLDSVWCSSTMPGDLSVSWCYISQCLNIHFRLCGFCGGFFGFFLRTLIGKIQRDEHVSVVAKHWIEIQTWHQRFRNLNQQSQISFNGRAKLKASRVFSLLKKEIGSHTPIPLWRGFWKRSQL